MQHHLGTMLQFKTRCTTILGVKISVGLNPEPLWCAGATYYDGPFGYVHLGPVGMVMEPVGKGVVASTVSKILCRVAGM